MKKHFAGSEYVLDGTKYLLAQVDSKEFSLINMRNGNRWVAPYKVESEKSRVWMSQMEFDMMVDDTTAQFVQYRDATADHPFAYR